jgi:uncharacterized protein
MARERQSTTGRLMGTILGTAAETFVDVAGRLLESDRLPPDDHRPWPVPREPWAITQTWHHVLFAHWPVSPTALRPLVPAALRLETFERAAWVGIVAFAVTGARLRGVPAIPGFSDFAEVNVRTYVSAEDRPGVYFFSLDAASALSVMGASAWYGLAYYLANADLAAGESGLRFKSERRHPGAPDAVFAARYQPRGAVTYAARGTLGCWLTERYCAYTWDGASLRRAEIHHPPWPLQNAEAVVTRNTVARAAGIELSGPPRLVHYAERIDAVVWPPCPVRSAASRAGRTSGRRVG